MPAQLLSLNDGPSILLDKPILLVGRHPECDIQIDSRKVSRRHCCIAQVNDYLIVRDLGSTNGVRINGVRVLEGRLKASDELTIGGCRYRVSWDMLPDVPMRQEPSSRRREEVLQSPRQVPGADDDLLESCDEPVALPEPGAAPVGVPVKNQNAGPQLPTAPAKPENEFPSLPAAQHSEPLIPEVLKLAPSSDMDLGQSQPLK
jgi:predicted component of type VI protein secretion system